MEVIPLDEATMHAYLHCLEPWSAEMREAGDWKVRWFARMKDRGLVVRIARDDEGQPIGMIQAVPARDAPIVGPGLYFIQCIWVHGYGEGVGDHQGKGVGKALLSAAEEAARDAGAHGIAAWGLSIPVWMKARWYKKQGYRVVDHVGIKSLLFKPFETDAAEPRWLGPESRPIHDTEHVVVTACRNGWCQATNVAFERTAEAVKKVGGTVELRVIDTGRGRQAMENWGTDEALFFDDRVVRVGPPPSVETLEKKLRRQVRKK